MTDVQHSIKVAARRCGLTTHVIRVWEKRYDAVSPDRTDTNRRLYSEAEIERLTLLRVATQAGHSIGNIARLPTKKLRELAVEAIHMPAAPLPKSHAAATDTIDAALAAIRQLSSAQLEEIFERAAVAYGQHGLLEKVIAPLAVKVGELWQNGVLTAAHEHFTSAVIRNFLVRNSKPYALNGSAPTIVVATPAGQLHEIGAVMVAAAASDMGWRVIYLGTSLPAAEIVGAVVQNQARALALSLVFPGDDPLLAGELESLHKQLPAGVKIIAGGRAAGSYRAALQQLGAEVVGELREIYPILERMRVPAM